MVTAAEWTPLLGAFGGSAGTAVAAAAATAAANARIVAVWATVDTAADAMAAGISAAKEVPSSGVADGKPTATAATEAAAVTMAMGEEINALQEEVARLRRDKEVLAGAGRRLCGLLADGAFPL